MAPILPDALTDKREIGRANAVRLVLNSFTHKGQGHGICGKRRSVY